MEGRPVADQFKKGTQITYPDILNLQPYCTAHFAGEEAVYKLKALIRHHGPSPDSGHYTAVQKFPSGKWVVRDDARAPEESSTSKAFMHHEAVMALLYERDNDR